MWLISLCEDKFLSAKRGRTFVCPRSLHLLVCIRFRCRELVFRILSCWFWFIGEKAGTYDRELPWPPPAPFEIRCRDLDKSYLPVDQLDGPARGRCFLPLLREAKKLLILESRQAEEALPGTGNFCKSMKLRGCSSTRHYIAALGKFSLILDLS